MKYNFILQSFVFQAALPVVGDLSQRILLSKETIVYHVIATNNNPNLEIKLTFSIQFTKCSFCNQISKNNAKYEVCIVIFEILCESLFVNNNYKFA